MMRTLTVVAALTASLFIVGCQQDQNPNDRSTTGPDVTPHYEAGHYNGAVNSTGSRVGVNNPGASGGASLNGGSGTSNSVPLNHSSGTSDQNGGSSSPTGATGSGAGH